MEDAQNDRPAEPLVTAVSAAGSRLPGALREAKRGVLFYGITPPRETTSAERADEIARTTIERLTPLDLDALVLYDVDAENDRSPADRPFPFLPMLDPAHFHADHLQKWPGSVVIYRCVGKYSEDELRGWLDSVDPDRVLTVFVGSSSHEQKVALRLDDAHRLRAELRPELSQGGVLIAERHARRGDEHLRMLAKQEQGCSFFVSQIFYDLDLTRNVLSDYAYACRERAIAPRPVVLTTSACGSAKTLEFMTWLGVDVPGWLQNDIRYTDDPLGESYEQCLVGAREVIRFCRRLELPFGINVESVTNRRTEIDASVELAREVRGMLRSVRI